ncbi:DeoR/GlpR family DNA-binding transcription regulator [Hypericibacter adhaerens]|jgi:DeoR family glycerol-3-phosphate regulon repressor|nr:DeoR/GlpR family DNA-binding transcription regulator [Hypericibacter adhaerens]
MATRKVSAASGSRTEAGRMLAATRQSRLLSMVKRTGAVSIVDAAAALDVSGMTIRRDLERLEARGLLARTHGGALARSPAPGDIYDAEEPAFEQRRRRNAAAKARIAATAARLVGPGEALALDVGSSVLALAETLAVRTDLRLFTNNLHAALALSRSRCTVELLGGQLRGAEMAVIGPVATAQVEDYYFDWAFLGVSGVTEAGYFDYAPEDTEIKRAFIARASRTAILCDASKFDHRALARICGLGEVSVLVTDRAPPSHLRRALDAAKVEIRVAAS